ncbi:MAG: asparagine--tRNA ligase [Myxococcota bacterium]|nr:asparagine--tRNA ligase [Myxococcota bacterium]
MDDSIKSILAREAAGGSVVIRGWLRTVRHSKNVSFLEVTDGSCFSGLQVVAAPELPEYESCVLELGTGCSVEIEGELVESRGKGQRYEIHASRVVLVGAAADDYPLQKKRHSLEFLRTLGHLRTRTNTLGAVLRVRNAATVEIHNFFQEQGFINLHSPIITLSDAEGAGEMFRVSTLNAEAPPRGDDGKVDFSQDFFGSEAHLTVSGQLEAEIAALSHSKVYTFGPTFRSENSNTTRHLAEFWMVEPEVAFCDLNALAELAESFLKFVFRDVMAACPDDFEFFDQRIQPGIIESLEAIASSSFERIPYTEAISILEGCGKKFEFPVQWGIDLQSEHERYLVEKHFMKPVIIVDYPAAIKAFYMRLNDRDEQGRETVAAMDILFPGVGEIMGGSQREERLDVLQQRCAAFDIPAEEMDWYLDTRRFGTAVHAGFGLGFERLVMFVTGMMNIRDVIPFPRAPKSAEF